MIADLLGGKFCRDTGYGLRTALPILTSLILAAGLLLPCSYRLEAQSSICGSKEYLDNLPVPPPKNLNVKRQVQLVNCSNQVILGAANAAHDAGQPPWPVFPQDGTWVMQPYGTPNNANVLTIDIPPQWYGQFQSGGVAPNFWGRTGCRYDLIANRAQCETGGCAGQYDCSSANISPPPGTTLAEWTFYQQFGNVFIDSPDISAVNGANLTIDIAPRGGDDLNPLNPKDFHWLKWNYPLTVHGSDLRSMGKCSTPSAGSFAVKRSDIDQTKSVEPNYPLLGYVIVDSNGNPTMPSGDNSLACLSNCGRYKFPVEVGKTGCNPNTDGNCYAWTTFCAGNESVQYGQQCMTDADCLQFNGGVNYHIACFKKQGPNGPGTCELRAFYNGSASQCNNTGNPQPAGPASKVPCNNTYGSVNPLDMDNSTKFDWSDQPANETCANVTFNNQPVACIGDDTLHAVLHGAYTWPNDPEVFGGDASVYRIIFAPGGTPASITPAEMGVPLCSSLPDNYMYSQNRTNCGIPVNNQGAVFGIGRVANNGSNKWQSSGHDWPCNLDERGAGDNGVICRWNPPPAGNCTPPVTDDTNVTASACGRIDSGVTVMSGSITPSHSGDGMFVEVAVPKLLNTVSLPASVSGCVPAQGMGAWTLVASQPIHTNQGMIAWYAGTSNTSVACNVTVTLTSKNPAEIKVYDVPRSSGKVEVMSSATGDFNGGPPFPSVSAGSAVTANANDLVLGALLMVNQQPTPITYWTNWLTNGANMLACLNNNQSCPTDDGTDYLPGYSTYSSNSDAGHQAVGPGTHYFHRDAYNIGQFSWGGLAIYVQLN